MGSNGLLGGPSRSELKRILESQTIDEQKLLRWPIEVWVSCGEQFIPMWTPPTAAATTNDNQERKLDQINNRRVSLESFFFYFILKKVKLCLFYVFRILWKRMLGE